MPTRAAIAAAADPINGNYHIDARQIVRLLGGDRAARRAQTEGEGPSMGQPNPDRACQPNPDATSDFSG
jgi:hypothetical protein